MQRTFRRILFLLLAIVIAAAVPLTAAAQPDTPVTSVDPVARPVPALSESADTSMETALIAAKNLIKIDDDVFTEFNYSSSFSNYETMEGLLWTFQWSSPAGGYIYATLTADGILLQYRKYMWDENRFGFAVVDKNAAVAIADGFIRKANPDTYAYYKVPADIYTGINNSEYGFSYYAQINGYNFEAAYIYVNVNKFTGEMVGYGTSRVDPVRFNFEKAEDLVSESDAVSAYVDKIGLSLEYRSYYDYEKNSVNVFPVYVFNSHSDRFIGAKSGDVVTYVYDLGVNDVLDSKNYAAAPDALAEDAGYSGGTRASLTPAELTAIDQAAGFITSEQALLKLLEAAELKNLDVASFSEQYISLSRDWYSKNQYFYYVNLYKFAEYDEADDTITNVSGRVDAATGRVTSFSFNYAGYPSPTGQRVTTEKQAEQAVTAFLKRVAPGEFAKTKLDAMEPPAVEPYYYRRGNYYFNYVRYENGIPFRDNGINVTLHENTGKITSYSLNWYDEVTFPSVSNVITPQRALTGFVEQNGSKINYITIGEGNAALVYDFRSQELIDPFTGKALDYTGMPWTDTSVRPDYSDVMGHWSESYVTKLADNGVYMWGGKFEPEKIMTELEFLNYLMLIESQYYPAREDIKMYYAQHGVEVEASPDKLLTRQESARIIAEYLGYGKLAKQSEWFVYPFKDNVAREYKGYITICYMLGIINGDAGRFNAASNVTRAHAATMLHNLIISKSK